MILYRYGKMVAVNFANLLAHIIRTGATSFEIDCCDIVDSYLTTKNDPHKVYEVQDPRLDQFFGTYKIPNRVKLRGEWRSYVSLKYDKSTDIIHAKRFYKERLIEECWYVFGTGLVQKHVYYGHNPKLQPTVLELSSEGNVFTYKKHYYLLGKNDYDMYFLDLDNCTISSKCKRTKGKDWYETSSSTEQLQYFDEVASRLYFFNYRDFMLGTQYHGFIPRG